MLKKLTLIATFMAVTCATPALADGHSGGDAEKGKKVFKKCMSCHAIGEGAKVKVGPPLTDIIGRKVASVEGMKYGKSISKLGEKGMIWTDAELFAYLKNPKKYLRKTLDDKKAKSKMAYKLKKDGQRANVIAYLRTFAKPEALEAAKKAEAAASN